MKALDFIVFLVIVAFLMFAIYTNLYRTHTEEDAKKFFQEDLAYTYPDADIREIVSVKKIDQDNYFLKAHVTKGFYTPCPEKIEVEYTYPIRNFLSTQTKLVSGCKVCIEDKKNCYIIYPEEAIIASHTYPGTERIAEFIKIYPKAKPSVEFLENYSNYNKVWKIEWKDESTEQKILVYINQADNSIIKIE
jgi:hypothetical protein